jgi:hypothetical protein
MFAGEGHFNCFNGGFMELRIDTMDTIESLYKKDGDKILIEIKLTSFIQMFNSFDPAPFHEKELDTAAENYIVDAVKDFPKTTQFKIIVYLPENLVQTEQAKTIGPAIRNHFQYLILATDLLFLSVALVARQMVSHLSSPFLAQLLADAFLIIGWVAMWEPITVLLYELWPIIQTKKIYERISTMEIEIRPYQK